MFNNVPILSMITFLPLIVALGLMFISRISKGEAREQLNKNAPLVALIVSSVVLLLSVLLVWQFDSSTASYQFEERVDWLGGGIELSLIHI